MGGHLQGQETGGGEKAMDIDGTYGFVYCGNRGLGAGVFSINGDRFEGRDLAGGSYNGTATQDRDGNIVRQARFDPRETAAI